MKIKNFVNKFIIFLGEEEMIEMVNNTTNKNSTNTVVKVIKCTNAVLYEIESNI
jgi:hypothetical protein